ncbi:sensor histidine kinase [Plantactinospora sp. B24E8]|uniref:sensor histidine kinase n=1 Tax=Plantactinospora sp. B24E8 TaxID=3153567 RepID=UPI00325FA455
MARPRGAVSPETGRGAWQRRYPLWDLYFGLAAVATTVFVLTDLSRPGSDRARAVVLLAALVGWYLVWGRRVARDEVEGWRGGVYLGVALLLYVPAVASVSAASFVLLALCAQAYMVLPALPATGAVVLFNLAGVVVFVLRTGEPRDALTGPGPVALVVVLISAVVGTWARQVTRQNEERAVLIEELDASRAEVARLSHEAGVAAERQRLAGDIHDTIAQGLTSVVLLLQAAETELDRDLTQARRHLRTATGMARDNLAEARALVGALTPVALAESSLADATRRLVDRLGTETGLVGRVVVAGEPRALPTRVEVVLLRVVQEALANVRKHADATSVTVRLTYRPGGVLLVVTDDGRGFGTPAAGGYGLGAMSARVAQVSGRLAVESRSGAGTTVQVEVADG